MAERGYDMIGSMRRGSVPTDRRCASLAAGVWLLTLTVRVAAQPVDVTISHHARGMFPGEALLLRVGASGLLTEVRATAFDKTVRFYQAADGVWRGLVGIDLLVEPGGPRRSVAHQARGRT